jgi:hypothetical protein
VAFSLSWHLSALVGLGLNIVTHGRRRWSLEEFAGRPAYGLA